MNLKTYRAFTMAEALAAVKRDLGADAAILHTRTYKRGGVLGMGRRTVVEVTAAHAGDVPAEKQINRSDRATRARRAAAAAPSAGAQAIPAPALRSVAARNAYTVGPGASASTEPNATSAPAASAAPTPTSNDAAKKLDLLAAIEEHRRLTGRPPLQKPDSPAGAASSVEPKPHPGLNSVDAAETALDVAAPRSVPPSPRAHDQHNSAAQPASASAGASSSTSMPPRPVDGPTIEPLPPVARRFILRDPQGSSQPVVQVPRNSMPIARDAPQDESAGHAPVAVEVESKLLSAVERSNRESAAVQSEIHSIRDMVAQILVQQRHAGPNASRYFAARLNAPLAEMYNALLDQDLSETLGQTIIERAMRALPDDAHDNPSAIKRAVRAQLIELIAVSPVDANAVAQSRATRARPYTLALIGPTGVGKTTTLAKLAATYKLRHGLRVGLVTSDTYRIAAVDQLRTYAEIIGVPVKVALTPYEIENACEQLRDCDVILIDTAGRSQRDSSKLEELRGFIAAAEPDDVHLVLSATANEKVLAQEIEAFSRVRADRLILTKLDEAVSFGHLVNVVRRVGKPLSHITTGQEVPDHFEPADAARIADLVLGGPLHDETSADDVDESKSTAFAASAGADGPAVTAVEEGA